MMRPPEGRVLENRYGRIHRGATGPSINDLHIPVLIREMNAPLRSPFGNALRSVY